jgi:hypothetical protein
VRGSRRLVAVGTTSGLECEQLALKALEGCMGRLADDWGQRWMGERERWRRHVLVGVSVGETVFSSRRCDGESTLATEAVLVRLWSQWEAFYVAPLLKKVVNVI